MHILQNAASIGDAAAMNAASRNRLFAADRQRNYLDRMSTAAQQQQWDRDCERHAKARARLIDQERHQQRDRNREQHRQARGQQDLHIAACVPLSEFDEAIVPVLDIGGRTAECQ